MRLDGTVKKLKKSKVSPAMALASKKVKKQDKIKIKVARSQKKKSKDDTGTLSTPSPVPKLSKKESLQNDVPSKKSKKILKEKKNLGAVHINLPETEDAIDKKHAKKGLKAKKGNLASQKKTSIKKVEVPVEGVKSTKIKGGELDPAMLKNSCEASLKLITVGVKSQAKENLFSNTGEPVMMQVDTFKVPKTAPRVLRCLVPHGLYGSEPDICLIVPDIKRGRKKDETYARYVQQYEDMLHQQGVTQIKQVIPFTQLRSEYSQFEMKRRLLKMFDVFLCDGRIQGHVGHFLGSIFHKARKIPIPVHAVKHENKEWSIYPKLKEIVKSALHKIHLPVHSHGTTFGLQVGHSSFTPEQLARNVQAVWKKLSTDFPGGITNIRTAYLKGARSLPAPIYASLMPPKKAPVAKPKPGFVAEPVEGELSTVLGQHVKVMPDGDIIVSDHRTQEDIDFLKVDPDSLPKHKKEALKRKLKDNKKSNKRIKTEPEEEDDGDLEDEDIDNIDNIDMKDVDAAENAYLTHWVDTNSVTEIEEQKIKGKKNKEKKNKDDKIKGKALKGKKKINGSVKNSTEKSGLKGVNKKDASNQMSKVDSASVTEIKEEQKTKGKKIKEKKSKDDKVKGKEVKGKKKTTSNQVSDENSGLKKGQRA